MDLNWKSFRIHLPSFQAFLKENCPNTDGISATLTHFQIITKENFTTDEHEAIMAYYDGLTETGEAAKFLQRDRIAQIGRLIIKSIVLKELADNPDITEDEKTECVELINTLFNSLS